MFTNDRHDDQGTLDLVRSIGALYRNAVETTARSVLADADLSASEVADASLALAATIDDLTERLARQLSRPSSPLSIG